MSFRNLLVLCCGLPGFLLSMESWPGEAGSQKEFEGYWSGVARTQAESTRLELDLGGSEGEWSARLSLLDIGVRGWPAESVNHEANRLQLVFRADSGPQPMTLQIKNGEIRGTWNDPRFTETANLRLVRSTGADTVPEQRVKFSGPAGTIGASLFLPAGDGPFPGVVFLHGSGPQPRDANRWAAQAMASEGVAALIFDKRGVGESEGDFTRVGFKELAEDGIAAAEFLLALNEVTAVGFTGHSQGGWIGPLAGSLWPKTCFIIASAGPAVPPSRETQWPVIRALREAGYGNVEQEKARALFDLWHNGVRRDKWSAFRDAFERIRQEPWFEASGISWLEQPLAEEVARHYRLYMDHDPIAVLMTLDTPLLALLSPDDESIDAMETADILGKLASKGRQITVRLYPGYDHGMRKLGAGGQPARWPSLPENYYSEQVRFIQQSTGFIK